MKCLARLIVLLGVAVIAGGCSSMPARNPVPLDQAYRAQVFPGVPAVRAWAGSFSDQFEEDLVESVRQEMRTLPQHGAIQAPIINILALSGGAEYGAFGAGFMNGWTRSGNRPVFKFVTGISAGALIAPFAFLGPAYDPVLKEGFTTIGPRNIYQKRGLSALWSDSLLDSAPLAALIEKYITDDVIRAVANAHRRGRRLYIGTANLDADRLVVWNIGAIATSGRPGALELIRKIILASSSIPVTFPPVLINVTVDGKSYDEMHVDGGVKAQLFLTAATINMMQVRGKLGLKVTPEESTKLYVVRNATVGPEPEPVPRKLNSIMGRSLTQLLKSQARSDLERVHHFAHQQGFGFYWIAIPKEYKPQHKDSFNTLEMNRLFKTGYDLGLKKNPWRGEPPAIGQR
ncbi:MAG: hypothetical protein AMS22_06940 [Thiotrichales bacterium SG8_50]|nr:MAG: hypothetical protein AMS22_06940 [Thiotrichales bacterium SG8_50]